MKFLTWLTARAKEPSTMAAVSVLGTLIGLPPGTIDVVAQVAIAACAVAGAVTAEKK